ncbi:carbohydrate kinase family protein [Fusibacter tunisiensis]|uniref:Fructokinase n=1 Tax=Fusibacter tunisiensis TaxID=1008308 RepID=A0ABS2MQJ9_9FIRM|nr:carbohydrate kinase [Fusibacter tunisiensis]MBM7561682.1 fructokinase [Fusibacter tunisiensis]
MKSIVCIGELLIDFIGSSAGKKIANQTSFMMKPGGAPGNVACTIGALGGDCSLLSSVGNDGFGEFLRNTVESYCVDTTLMQRSHKATTLAFVSVEDNGDRDFNFIRGADADLELNEKDLGTYDIFHFGAATAFLEGALNKTYHQVLDMAERQSKFIVFDPNYRSAFWTENQNKFVKVIEPFMKSAHLIKLSDEEALIVTGENTLERAIESLKQKYKGLFAITLGGEGARLFNRTYDLHVPTKKVAVVDTTGAGDAFIGSMIYELSKLESIFEMIHNPDKIREIAIKANEIAADVCTAYGALTALKKKSN